MKDSDFGGCLQPQDPLCLPQFALSAQPITESLMSDTNLFQSESNYSGG